MAGRRTDLNKWIQGERLLFVTLPHAHYASMFIATHIAAEQRAAGIVSVPPPPPPPGRQGHGQARRGGMAGGERGLGGMRGVEVGGGGGGAEEGMEMLHGAGLGGDGDGDVLWEESGEAGGLGDGMVGRGLGGGFLKDAEAGLPPRFYAHAGDGGHDPPRHRHGGYAGGGGGLYGEQRIYPPTRPAHPPAHAGAAAGGRRAGIGGRRVGAMWGWGDCVGGAEAWQQQVPAVGRVRRGARASARALILVCRCVVI